MSMISKQLTQLDSLVQSCEIHVQRLNAARKALEPTLPLKGVSIPQLKNEELGYMELLMSRFSKLQDTLGTKLFPLTLDLMQQRRDNESFLDLLHKLEKLHLLPSTKWWLTIRELQNHIVHDYPENPELMAANFNQCAQAALELEEYWCVFRSHLEDLQKEWRQQLSGEEINR